MSPILVKPMVEGFTKGEDFCIHFFLVFCPIREINIKNNASITKNEMLTFALFIYFLKCPMGFDVM